MPYQKPSQKIEMTEFFSPKGSIKEEARAFPVSFMRRPLFLFTFFWILISSCEAPKREAVINGTTMGTTYQIKLVLQQDLGTPQTLKVEIDSILAHVNRQMSLYQYGSEINIFNRSLSTEPFPVSEEVAFVVRRALHWSVVTDGAFDITIFPLLFLWGFGPGQETEPLTIFPDSAAVQKRLAHVGYGKMKVKKKTLIKNDPRVMVDLNAIAKGFGVDAVYEHLESQGVAHMMVEIGGEVRVRGKNKNNQFWIIAIERPHLSADLERAFDWICEPEEGAVATSGDYRNFFEVDGELFSHEIDPRSGYPAKTKVASATITAPNCTDADALATALIIMGEKEGLQLVEAMDGVEAFLILREGRDQFRWVKSSGMKIRER